MGYSPWDLNFVWAGSLWLQRLSSSCGGWGLLASCSAGASHCPGFSLAVEHVGSVVAILGLWSMGSVVVAHRLNCSTECGIFPDQGSNLYLLRWQENFFQ